MNNRLTELTLKSMKPPIKGQDEYFDIAPPGFGLRVSYKGSKTFFLVKRVAGHKVRFTLGKFPDLGLKDARLKAVQIIDQIADGLDPRVMVREAKRKIEVADGNTFKAVVEKFFKSHVEVSLRAATQTGYTFALKREPTAKWRDWPITSITKSDVKEIIRNYQDCGQAKWSVQGRSH
jgi:Arm DNA-binding domain